jgi:hypothetical protein
MSDKQLRSILDDLGASLERGESYLDLITCSKAESELATSKGEVQEIFYSKDGFQLSMTFALLNGVIYIADFKEVPTSTKVHFNVMTNKWEILDEIGFVEDGEGTKNDKTN